MSNSLRIKKKKPKDKEAKKTTELPVSKYGAKFMQNKREKGTIATNFSGKSSKSFSRKKT